MTRAGYRHLTEQWDTPMSATQIAMANTRYRLAADHASGRDVLEVACGAGFGLAYLATVAATIVGGDIEEANVREARARSGVPVARLDAHHLPFAAGRFDVVVLYESIYYLARPRQALEEVARVLRPGGTLLACLPNRERPGFHPSPHSVAYPSAAQLDGMLREAGYEPEIYGGFPVGGGGVGERLFLTAAAAATKLRLVPRTLKGRARIKRLLHGRLPTFQGVDGATGAAPLDRLAADASVRGYANLYAVARRSRG